MQDIFANHTVMTRLTVTQPGDKYEQEADRIAEQTVTAEEPAEKPARINKIIQRQVKSDISGGETPLEREIHGLKQLGTPLPVKVRDYFQPRFGVDLGTVRVHTGATADRLSLAIKARAFAFDNNIVFAQHEYQPETSKGKKLLAHELTHVIQQKREIRRQEYVQRRNMTSSDAIEWYTGSTETVKTKFEYYTANLLKSMLLAAIEISQEERERYFGPEGEIDELVDLLKDNYYEKYQAADILRARALIRFHQKENFHTNEWNGPIRFLDIPGAHFSSDEEELAPKLLQLYKFWVDEESKYDPSLIEKLVAWYTFDSKLREQYLADHDLQKRNEIYDAASYQVPVSGCSHMKYDADALATVREEYPEFYQAEMLDAITNSDFYIFDVASYPVLADVRTDFYEMSFNSRQDIPNKIRDILDLREDNSKSLYDRLENDRGLIWNFLPLIEYTLHELGFNKETGPGKIIWDEYNRRETDRSIINWILTGLGIVLGIAGAILGGVGAGAAAIIFGSLGIGLGILDLCLEINNYSLESSASEATCKIVLSDRPSPLGIFMAIVGLVMDVADVAGGISKVLKQVSEEVCQNAAKTFDEALEEAHEILTSKGIIKQMNCGDFVRLVKESVDKFPKEFTNLAYRSPAFYKAFAADPAGFARMISESSEEVIGFITKYGPLLTKDELLECMDEGVIAVTRVSRRFGDVSQELMEAAISRTPAKYQSNVRQALENMTQARRDEVVEFINNLPGSRVVEKHHWIRQAAIKRFPEVNKALLEQNFDLYDWAENLSLIAGHKGSHLGSYREMVDEIMRELEDGIAQGLKGQELIDELKLSIKEIKDSVIADYTIMNNYKIIVLD